MLEEQEARINPVTKPVKRGSGEHTVKFRSILPGKAGEPVNLRMY